MKARGSQNHPGDLLDAQGSPQSAPGVVLGGSWGSPGALLSAPGLLWGTFWMAWGGDLERFGMILGTQGGVRSENSEKLEFDDRLNENAMFLRSQGLQNEVKMIPKRAEKKKKSREEGKREQRSAKRGLESVLRALWGDTLRFRGSPGEGRWSSRLDLYYWPEPAFRRGWALKVSKSGVR